MIMERGARPDAPPNPKRSRTTLAVIVALGVGLAWLWRRRRAEQTLGHCAWAKATPRAGERDVGEARDRWRCNSVTEWDDVLTCSLLPRRSPRSLGAIGGLVTSAGFISRE